MLRREGDLLKDGDWILIDYHSISGSYLWMLDCPGDEVITKVTTDIEDTLQTNQELYNESQVTHKRFGDGQAVATIPLDLFFKNDLHLAEKQGDDRYIKKFLNDFDNRPFRSFRGKV